MLLSFSSDLCLCLVMLSSFLPLIKLLVGFSDFDYFRIKWSYQEDIQYRPKVSHHPRARRESRRVLQESRRALRESLRALQESRRARWQKICKYSGLTLARDFNYPLI